MAQFDTIQTAEASSTSPAANTVTVSFSAAVAGNLLVAGFTRSQSVTWGADPSGWTAITGVPDAAGGSMASKWFYKIAAGGETTVTMTTTETGVTFRGVMAEFEGPFAASPLDVTAEDETNISTPVTSQTSGTTATTAQASELAVAFFGADRADTVTDGHAYSNSFTEVHFASTTSSTSRAMAALAKKVLSATGTQQCTFSTTDTGDDMYGAIATFKAAAGGGGLSIPVAMSTYKRHRPA